MKSIPCLLTVTTVLLLATHPVLADEAEKLVEALNLQQRWSEGIAGPAISRYLERSETTASRYYDAVQAKQMVEEQRALLDASLTWDEVGRPIALRAYRKCPSDVLEFVRLASTNQPISKKLAKEDVQIKAGECQKQALAALTQDLQNAFQALAPKLEAIYARYQAMVPAQSTNK